jgi:hypothetical protein
MHIHNVPMLSQSYDSKRAKTAMHILTRNRTNEIKQIADNIEYLASGEDWEENVVSFCLHIDMCFKDLTRAEVEDTEVHKCMNLMQRMAKDKSLNEVQKIQKLAYDLAQEFKLIYEES